MCSEGNQKLTQTMRFGNALARTHYLLVFAKTRKCAKRRFGLVLRAEAYCPDKYIR